MSVLLIPLLNDEFNQGNRFVGIRKRVAYADAFGKQAKVCDFNCMKYDVLSAFIIRIGVNTKYRELAEGPVVATMQRCEICYVGHYEKCEAKTNPAEHATHGCLDSGWMNLVPRFDWKFAERFENMLRGDADILRAVKEPGAEGIGGTCTTSRSKAAPVQGTWKGEEVNWAINSEYDGGLVSAKKITGTLRVDEVGVDGEFEASLVN